MNSELDRAKAGSCPQRRTRNLVVLVSMVCFSWAVYCAAAPQGSALIDYLAAGQNANMAKLKTLRMSTVVDSTSYYDPPQEFSMGGPEDSFSRKFQVKRHHEVDNYDLTL